MRKRHRADGSISRPWVLPAAVLVVASLYLARELFIPISLGVLFAFLLNPLVSRVRRWGLGRVAAVFVVEFVALLLVLVLAAFLTVQIADFVQDVPSYSENAQRQIRAVWEPILSLVARTSQSVRDATATASSGAETAAPTMAAAGTLETAIAGLLAGGAAAVASAIATSAIVFVLAGAILLQGSDLRDRVVRLIGDRQVSVTTQALDDAAARVSNYLLAQTLLNGSQGVIIAVGLTLIGLPGAVVWGVLWALLRYLPYLGIWLASLLPSVVALGYFEGWTPLLLMAVLFVVVEAAYSAVLEPWLYGSRTGISSLAVLVSALFWTWLWGWVGLVLATPLTVCLAVLGRYVEPLQFLHILLGDEPMLHPSARFYQRLLTLHSKEARQIIAEQLSVRPTAEVFETVVIPVLVDLEADARRGMADDEKVESVRSQIGEILRELPKAASSEPAAPGEPVAPAAVPAPQARGEGGQRCLCLPARDAADALCAYMVQMVAAEHGVDIEVMPGDLLINEKVQGVMERRPDLLLVSALSADRGRYLRYILKRLADGIDDTGLIVGIWNADHTHEELQRTLGRAGDAATVVTSFAEALDAIRFAGALGRASSAASTTTVASLGEREPRTRQMDNVRLRQLAAPSTASQTIQG